MLHLSYTTTAELYSSTAHCEFIFVAKQDVRNLLFAYGFLHPY